MAIRHTLATIQVRDDGKSLPRSGTPVTYDSRSRRRMLMCLRLHPKLTYKQRREHTGLPMSDSYIYRLGTRRWRKYMWSDECSVERGKEGKVIWVWGYSVDKWKPSHVKTYKKGKGMRVMVSAAFWGDGERSDLLIL
ncbi:hypothetical protein DL95DRAFT_348019, partial [Leptodontidium sp. 2 PMI_412]